MTADTLRSWAVELPIDEHLSMNDRLHHQQEARIRATIREVSWAHVRAARIPRLDRVAVRLDVVPPDRRRRDRHNLHPTLKPILDALVDARVIPDDTPDHVDSEMIALHEADGSRRWTWLLTVREAA